MSVSEPNVGLENYVWLFGSELNRSIFIRTFSTSLFVTLLCLVISYPYAYLMSIATPAVRSIMLLVVLIPLWTSLMVRTLAWVIILQDTGIINKALIFLGLNPVSLIRTNTGVMIGMTQMLMPFMVLPLYAVMSKFDHRYLKASYSLGANPVTAFLTVYLPLTRSGIIAGSITVFVMGLGFYIIPALLGSPRNTMVSALIYQQVSGLLQWGRGSAMGVFLLVTALLTIFVVMKAAKVKSIGTLGRVS